MKTGATGESLMATVMAGGPIMLAAGSHCLNGSDKGGRGMESGSGRTNGMHPATWPLHITLNGEESASILK